MNSRTFDIKLVALDRIKKLHSLRADGCDRPLITEAHGPKWGTDSKCWTYFKDHTLQCKLHKYNSGKIFLLDFVDQVNYQYIPGEPACA